MLLDPLGATVLAALGLLLWVMAWRGWRKRVAMRRWPTAPASIRGQVVEHPPDERRHALAIERRLDVPGAPQRLERGANLGLVLDQLHCGRP